VVHAFEGWAAPAGMDIEPRSHASRAGRASFLEEGFLAIRRRRRRIRPGPPIMVLTELPAWATSRNAAPPRPPPISAVVNVGLLVAELGGIQSLTGTFRGPADAAIVSRVKPYRLHVDEFDRLEEFPARRIRYFLDRFLEGRPVNPLRLGLVRDSGGKVSFQLLDGYHRLTAAHYAGVTTIRVLFEGEPAELAPVQAERE
jgi:hypothetical protein